MTDSSGNETSEIKTTSAHQWEVGDRSRVADDKTILEVVEVVDGGVKVKRWGSV